MDYPGKIGRITRAVVCCAIALMVLPAGASAQTRAAALAASRAASIVTLTQGGVAVWETDRVLMRDAGGSERSIRIPTRLAPGSRLRSVSSGMSVVVRCPDSSNVTLSGSFTAVLVDNVPPGYCMFRLGQGRIDVQTTGERTAVEAGEITMGARGTQYGISWAGNPVGFVLDGAATVQTSQANRRTLAQQRRATFSGQFLETTLSNQELNLAATVYAQADVARSPFTGAEAATARVEARQAYLQVFSNPQNANARVQLAATQLRLGLPAENVLYQADRVDDIQPGRADAALLRSQALARLGQAGAANQAMALAQTRAGGAGALATLEAQLGLQDQSSGPPLSVTVVRQTPSGWVRGQCDSRMWHRVTVSSGGQAVPGATVEVDVPQGRLDPSDTDRGPARNPRRLRLTTANDGGVYFIYNPVEVTNMPMTARATRNGYRSATSVLSITVNGIGCQP